MKAHLQGTYDRARPDRASTLHPDEGHGFLNTTRDSGDPGRFLELLERLRETFGLYEQAAALAEQQVRDAMAAADRIRRDALASADRERNGDVVAQLQAERDALWIERDELRRQRDCLVADREADERRFGEEIAHLRAQVGGMAGAIEDLVQQLERAASGSALTR
jgi:hypothetical protein